MRGRKKKKHARREIKKEKRKKEEKESERIQNRQKTMTELTSRCEGGSRSSCALRASRLNLAK
ncbi:hypothetical protein WN51_06344 [Melipona quadrifasciata]|uniref:Uncharacterized protein n=1 Tax=Melipona quadrifasciata TaxID=166423 RepID=A0A0N0U3I4_9HYME|nr:hypothetical protein WN51_06344 [Melipona quadrifasciata]